MKRLIRILLDYFQLRNDQDNPVIHRWSEIIPEFEDRIGYKFGNLSILQAAFTHLSWYRRVVTDPKAISPFERMEFLGDAILGLIVSEELFKKYPSYPEGKLSKLKAKLVSEQYLTMRANELDLGRYLIMSQEESKAGGRKRKSILSDAMEALICGIYLDSNMTKVKRFVRNYILEDFEKLVKTDSLTNFKSILQEHTQGIYQKPPDYKVIREEGPDHQKIFTVEVFIQGKLAGKGSGPNKKQAEQNAARDACAKLGL